MSSRSENDRYRPDTGAKEIGGIPPPCRNHLEPTAGDTPACTAASWLDRPRAIASQKRTRSTRRAVDGRPGDHIWPRIALILCCRLPTPIPHHLRIEVLRRPVESAQYTSIRYTERLAEIGAAPSVGSIGDSYDNSLAESTIGLYKTELIRRHGPWRTLDELELATLGYIDWFNHRRLHGEIGDIPPAELEATYYRQPEATTAA
jgi:transposase InsO family protein